jgi:hypothetical protein
MSGKIAPNNSESRQDTRVNVNLQGQTNSFFVEFAGQTVPITNIRDVSISGVGLELEQIIAQGETIELGFNSDDLNLKVKGTVAWCDAHHKPVAIGIEFTSESPQDNMLFFMAMRKFLDDFDGITMDI